MNAEKFRQEVVGDHPDGWVIDEAKVREIAEHMRQRTLIRDAVRARAIATWCYYETISAVVLRWGFNEACRLQLWDKAAGILETSGFARIEPRAAKRAALMLRSGVDA